MNKTRTSFQLLTFAYKAYQNTSNKKLRSSYIFFFLAIIYITIYVKLHFVGECNGEFWTNIGNVIELRCSGNLSGFHYRA